MSRTILKIKETLSTSIDLTIPEMQKQFRCELYDILFALLLNGYIVIDDKIKLSNYGLKYCNDVHNGKWKRDVCNFILYTIAFSPSKYPKHIGIMLEKFYNGEDVIESILMDGKIINIKFK